MISRATFIKTIELIQNLQDRTEKFDESIKAFTDDKDFTGFYISLEPAIQLLSQEVGKNPSETQELLDWWLFDNVDKTLYNSDGTIFKDVSNPGDLYDYITRNQSTPSGQQLETLKFVFSIIDKTEAINAETANDGHEERDALLEHIRTKIGQEYFMQTGDEDSVLIQRFPPYHLISKEEND